MNEKLPGWVEGFIGSVCPPGITEEIEGDLLQRFNRDVNKHGERAARRRLVWNAVRFFRLSIILRNKFKIHIIKGFMVRNYLKIAFRSILKQKSYTLLNVAGLSLGMAASLLILQYVKYERNFDTFHTNAENIYRIQYNVYHNGALTSKALWPYLRSLLLLKRIFQRSKMSAGRFHEAP
jgi:putative ABC transport system permease protein